MRNNLMRQVYSRNPSMWAVAAASLALTLTLGASDAVAQTCPFDDGN